MAGQSEPYAVIVIDAADFKPENRRQLLLLLKEAFQLSAEIRFYFPMRGDASQEIDRLFDQALKGLPMISKGIVYKKDLRQQELTLLLERAEFVLKSNPEIQQAMDGGSHYSQFHHR